MSSYSSYVILVVDLSLVKLGLGFRFRFKFTFWYDFLKDYSPFIGYFLTLLWQDLTDIRTYRAAIAAKNMKL